MFDSIKKFFDPGIIFGLMLFVIAVLLGWFQMDFGDIICAVGDSYLKNKDNPTNDPLEIFFNIFKDGNANFNKILEREDREYNKRRDKTWKLIKEIKHG